MTNELLNEETRRDRWVRLPYALMLMMVLIGGLSYVLDSRTRAAATQSAQVKAEAFIQRRIAEHEQAAKQPVKQPMPAPIQAVAPKTVQQSSAKIAQPVRPNQASTFSGIFTRINWRAKLNYLTSKPRWIIGASLVAFLGLILIVRRRRRQDAVNFNELLADIQPSVTPEIKLEVAKQPIEESAPSIFSLYSDEESADEGSFISTYIKPTISNFAESLRSVLGLFTNRQREERDQMHTLIPSVIRSVTTISVSSPMAGSQLNATGNLFRRAVLTRK